MAGLLPDGVIPQGTERQRPGLLNTRPAWLQAYDAFASQQDWKPTELLPDQEIKFRQWLMSTDWFGDVKKRIAEENDIPVERIDDNRVLEMVLSQGDYDYRGAWKSGVVTSPDEFDDGRLHWPDISPDGRMLKSPSHPTAWKEFFMQEFGRNPDELGLRTIEQAVEWSINRKFGR